MKAMKRLLFPTTTYLGVLSLKVPETAWFLFLKCWFKTNKTLVVNNFILIPWRWISAESCWSWFFSQVILVRAVGGFLLGFLVGDGREDMDSLWAVLVRSHQFTESTEKIEEDEKRRGTSVFYFLCVSSSNRCPWEHLYFFRLVSETKNTSQRSSGCSAGCCNILTFSLYCFLKNAQRKTLISPFLFTLVHVWHQIWKYSMF